MLLCCCGCRNLLPLCWASLPFSYFFYKYFFSFSLSVAGHCSWHLNGAFSKQNVAKTQRQVGENEPSNQARQQGSPAQHSTGPRNNCGIMYGTVLQGRQLCLQFLQLQDASRTGREREGSRLHCYGPNENAAAAASAAAVVFGLARAFYIN